MLPFLDKDDWKAMIKNSVAQTMTLSKTVMPIVGEPLRFYVASRTVEGLSYLVDLEELNRNGVCGCQDFQFRHWPKFNDGAKPNGGDSCRCWHIVQARKYFLDSALEIIARNYYEKKDEQKKQS